MMRRMVLGGLVLALIASVASAQQPKGPGRGPGFGGFGGGFGGMRASNLMLLRMPEVQKEIKMTDEQVKGVGDLQQQTMEKMREAMGDFRDFQNLSQEERTKRMEEARKKSEAVNKDTDEKLAKVLDEKQMARLKQLRLQREGTAAWSSPEVAKELGLTDEQEAKMKKIREESRSAGGFPGPDATQEERQEFFAKMQKQREKTQADLQAVLTEEQTKKWAEMKGPEFKFPQPTFGPGGKGKGGMKTPKKAAE